MARGYFARESYRAIKIKRAHARVASEQKRRHEAAVKIQSYWKMYRVRKGTIGLNSFYEFCTEKFICVSTNDRDRLELQSYYYRYDSETYLFRFLKLYFSIF